MGELYRTPTGATSLSSVVGVGEFGARGTCWMAGDCGKRAQWRGVYRIFVIGGLWEHAQARERRGKTGMFPVVIRTPLVLIHAVFMCVIGAVVGGVGGFGSVWFADRLIAHDAAIDIRILFAMAMCVCLILMWQVDWGRMARIGWRVTIRNIAPTSGYYFSGALLRS